MELSTQYLGLKLKNPLVASSSPLTWDLKSASALEQAGASAIIMPSLFEERINPGMDSNAPGSGQDQYRQRYLTRIEELKSALDIPVIASLNGVSTGCWVQHVRDIEQAGADALELNVYYIAADPDESSQQVEQRYVDVLTEVKKHSRIPVAMKLSHHFSAIIPLVIKLEQCGVAGVSLFNRFYQPDIDLESLKVMPRLELSNPAECLLRIRWIALLRQKVSMSLALTGGIHGVESILKGILAGADVTCMCSALIQNGTAHIGDALQHMTEWMQEKEFNSIDEFRGSLSFARAPDPSAYERANYIDVLDSYSMSSGVIE